MANYGRCGLADFITLSHRRSYFNFSEDRHSPPFSTRGDWDTRLAGSFDKARLVSSGPNTFLVLVTRATARVSTVSLALTPTIPRDFSLLGTASLPSPFQQSTTVLVMDHAKRLGHGKVWASGIWSVRAMWGKWPSNHDLDCDHRSFGCRGARTVSLTLSILNQEAQSW